MNRFSANLGFLWSELPLPDAIFAASQAGFDAVECHWPYDVPANEVHSALSETGIPMISLNTRRGEIGSGGFGLSAVPGFESEARAAIIESIDYGLAIGASAVHVMAGNARGSEARQTFLENLRFACQTASKVNIVILIEPLNRFDAPDYFLRNSEQARQIIMEMNEPNLKLMFDCYHVGRTEGDVAARFKALRPIIGHVQFASVPDRGPPDQGELEYANVFDAIAEQQWTKPLGAEYRPYGPTEESLGWMNLFAG